MGRDLSTARAILIGNSTYRADSGIPALPAAAECVTAMADLLSGPLCGWPRDRIDMLLDIAHENELARRIAPAIRDIHSVVLLYYVGHGLRTPKGKLALALGDTDSSPLLVSNTAILYESIAEMLRGCPARTKIVILDCCHAELGNRANSVFQSELGGLAEEYPVDGLYFMGASKVHEKARAPLDGSLTYFTQNLISTVKTGIPQRPEFLTLEHIFLELRRRLTARGLPEPVESSMRDARRFPFARNSAPPETHVDLVVSLEAYHSLQADVRERNATIEEKNATIAALNARIEELRTTFRASLRGELIDRYVTQQSVVLQTEPGSPRKEEAAEELSAIESEMDQGDQQVDDIIAAFGGTRAWDPAPIFDALQAALPVTDPRNERNSPTWEDLAGFLMLVVQAFDPAPFPRFRDPKTGCVRDVPLSTVVLPRVVALAETTGNPEWRTLAVAIDDTYLEHRQQGEAFDLNTGVNLLAREHQREDIEHARYRAQAARTALSLARMSAWAIPTESEPRSEPLLTDTDRPPPERVTHEDRLTAWSWGSSLATMPIVAAVLYFLMYCSRHSSPWLWTAGGLSVAAATVVIVLVIRAAMRIREKLIADARSRRPWGPPTE